MEEQQNNQNVIKFTTQWNDSIAHSYEIVRMHWLSNAQNRAQWYFRSHSHGGNAVVHMWTGKDYSIAMRGHLIVDQVLSHILIKETFSNHKKENEYLLV